MKARFVLFMTFCSSIHLSAQEKRLDTIKIPTVSVEESRSLSPFIQSIDSSALNNPLHHNLGEMLASRANLFIKSYGIGSLSTVSMRGSGASHTNVLWNDILLNSSSNGVVDLALYPNLFSDEVEVSYGNASLLQASGGIGGAIQLNNKVRFKKQQKLKLQQQVGSFGYRNSELNYSFGDEKWQSTTRVMYRKADNNFEYKDVGEQNFPTKEIENGGLEQRSIMQSAYYRPKENRQFEAHLWYYESDRNLPVLITLNNFNERQEDQSIRFLIGVKQFYSKSVLKIRSAMIKDDIFYQNDRLNAASESENISSRTVIDYEKKWKKVSWGSRLNIDVEKAKQASYENDIERRRLSYFSHFNYEMTKKLSADAGFRQEVIFSEDVFFLPFLSVNYQLNSNWMVIAKASQNVKYPTLNDLYWEFGGNESLLPEENNSLEFGINQKHILSQEIHLETKLSAYYSEINNFIQWQPSIFGYWQAENLKEVRVKGIETSLKLKTEKKVIEKSLFANYTYTQSLNAKSNHIHDESVDKQLIYIPEHQANIQIALNFKEYLFSYQWQFVGARYLSSDNSAWLPSYELSNISIGKVFRKSEHEFNLQFSVLNLFDLEYQAIEWRPMPNRNYQLSLTYQFK